MLRIRCKIRHLIATLAAAGLTTAGQTVAVQVTTNELDTQIGPFPAAANCHGLRRHLLDDPDWDSAMQALFEDNLIVLLERPRKEVDAEGNWWDYDAIDRFIERARNRWKAKTLAFLPQWTIRNWDGEKAPTDDEFDASAAIFQQLVDRYAPPGPLHVDIWMCNDEWPCGGFWYENPEEFAARYAELVRYVKRVNADLMVGGPVNCWPNTRVQKALLQACPELDFIAWNLFTTLDGTMPIERVLERTRSLGKNIRASRRLSKEVLGRTLPVMVSSYNLNGRAWDPPDTRLAAPVGAVWNAYALASMLRAGVHSAVIYNVLALDCGLFGPNDRFAVSAGMIGKTDAESQVNVRPMAYVHQFVASHFPRTALREVNITPPETPLLTVAAVNPDGQHALILVNPGPEGLTVALELPPGSAPRRTEPFSLPTRYLFCDQHSIAQGTAWLFNADGEAALHLPALSAWCLLH